MDVLLDGVEADQAVQLVQQLAQANCILGFRWPGRRLALWRSFVRRAFRLLAVEDAASIEVLAQVCQLSVEVRDLGLVAVSVREHEAGSKVVENLDHEVAE